MKKNPINIDFIKASEKHAQEVVEFTEKVWKNTWQNVISTDQMDYMLQNIYSAQQFEQLINKNHQFFLMMQEKKMVGYIAIYTTDGKTYDLEKIYIDAEQQGKGLGKALINFVEKEFSPEVFRLNVNRRNYKAINFYFQQGFRIEKVEDIAIGNEYEMNDFVMVKYLY